MKDAIGGGMLFNIVIIFVVAIVILFISSLSYTKAYKVKNRIIEIIEKHGIYESADGANSPAQTEINSNLNKMGYSIATRTNCSSNNLNNTDYKYCVYKKTTSDSSTYYYEVVTYVNFAFPVINEVLNIPVRGETKILGNKYDY